MDTTFKRHGIKLLLTILVVMFFCQQPFAGMIRKHHRSVTPAPDFNWSLQFSFESHPDDDDDDLSTNDYHGVRFALQRNYSEVSALRLSLGVGELQRFAPDNDMLFYADGYAVGYAPYYNYSPDGAYISLQYLARTPLSNRFSFYGGVGPILSGFDLDPAYTVYYYDIDDPYFWIANDPSDNITRLGLGVEGSFGLEWFLARNFSLMLEYGLTVEHRWYIFEYDLYDSCCYRVTETEAFADGWHLDNSRVKLGFAVHF